MNVRIAAALLIATGLAACQGEKTPEQKRAAGEILPGSASDAMLPIDTVRSQPPLAPQSEAARSGGKGAASEAAKTPAGTSSEPASAASAGPSPSGAASATPE